VKRLLILHHDLNYFLSHRLGVVQAVRAAGWEIEIAVPYHSRCDELRDAGLTWHPTELARARPTPLADISYIRNIARLLRVRTPHLVHAYATKPILLGGLALRLHAILNRQHIPFVATVSGLGIVFQEHEVTVATRVRRLLVEQLYCFGIGYKPSMFTFEHVADFDFFTSQLGLPPERGTVMPGAGLDLNAYRRGNHHLSKVQILFAGRLLKSKGVLDFVQAAALTNRDDIEWLIAGARDPDNADSLTEEEVGALSQQNVNFIGHVQDMPGLLARVDAVALPSRYPEGIPRILIEAAASGAVPIASDFPGSRALIDHKESGIILREPFAQSLALEVQQLALDRNLRERLGAAARHRVETGGFDERMIAAQFMRIYERVTGASVAS
jgi:glycosyltransferase involved in cell wall biosynthesis